jgi:hypothetical protein
MEATMEAIVRARQVKTEMIMLSSSTRGLRPLLFLIQLPKEWELSFCRSVCLFLMDRIQKTKARCHCDPIHYKKHTNPLKPSSHTLGSCIKQKQGPKAPANQSITKGCTDPVARKHKFCFSNGSYSKKQMPDATATRSITKRIPTH